MLLRIANVEIQCLSGLQKRCVHFASRIMVKDLTYLDMTSHEEVKHDCKVGMLDWHNIASEGMTCLYVVNVFNDFVYSDVRSRNLCIFLVKSSVWNGRIKQSYSCSLANSRLEVKN